MISPLRLVRRVLLPALALFTSAFAASVMAAPGNGKSDNSQFSAIYVLGDSLSDTGRASTKLSLPGEPFPPPPYAPGRFSNGRLWIEYFSPMVRRTYHPAENLAVAGSLSGIFLFPVPNQNPVEVSNVYSSLLPGMKQQLDQLAAPLDRNALYVVFGGMNDTFMINFSVTSGAASDIITQGVTNLLSIVLNLVARGAEKIVVIDMPDLGLTPRARSLPGNATAIATQYSRDFNAALNHSLDAIGYPVCRVSAFDLTRDFVEKPKKYGFTNVTDDFLNVWNSRHLDLAEADSYLFWDAVHPTTRAHSHLADEVFHALARAGLLANTSK